MRSFHISSPLIVASAVASTLAMSACNRPAAPVGRQVPGEPVETRSAHAPEHQPKSPAQTRAPYRTENVAFDVEKVASGLEHPWGLSFLPDGAKLVTERPGRMRIIGKDGTLSAPVAGVPKVDDDNQGGLLDVTLDPSFAESGVVFFSYSEPRKDGNGTAVARARLVRSGAPRLEGLKVIWRMTPTLDSSKHFGSRLVFSREGDLFVTTGERSTDEGRKLTQDLGSTLGKIVRIRPDGSVPEGNPFAGRQGARPEIWALGIRNVQAAALHPKTGELWVADHGPRGGDEIHVVRPGKNYGWPIITYGKEYAGGKVGDGLTQHPGMEQPLYYWDPAIAPSGMAFYDADLFPAWRGSLFVGGLVGKHLVRLTLEGERVVGEERLLGDRARVRTVKVGPEGAVYVLTDESDGELLALTPRGGR
jgi:aldose sugar dehydrogenase